MIRSMKKRLELEDRIAKLPSVELLSAIGWLLQADNILVEEFDRRFDSFVRQDLMTKKFALVAPRGTVIIPTPAAAEAWNEAIKIPAFKKQLVDKAV